MNTHRILGINDTPEGILTKLRGLVRLLSPEQAETLATAIKGTEADRDLVFPRLAAEIRPR